MAQLSLDVDGALGSNTYDEKHAPRPHLTVARKVSETALSDIQAVASQITLGWSVDRLVLFRSHTDPAGSIYEMLASHDLGSAAQE